MVDSRLPAVKQSAPRGFFPTRVLVIDPEPLIRWSICMALAAAGFDADSAATVEEAGQVSAAGGAPRVMLLDVHPDAPPQPQIERIRAVSPDCRLIVMSTARHTGRLMKPFEDVHVIEKPFDLATLVSVVTALAGASAPAAGNGQ